MCQTGTKIYYRSSTLYAVFDSIEGEYLHELPIPRPLHFITQMCHKSNGIGLRILVHLFIYTSMCSSSLTIPNKLNGRLCVD
jgi:hypothetical protein